MLTNPRVLAVVGSAFAAALLLPCTSYASTDPARSSDSLSVEIERLVAAGPPQDGPGAEDWARVGRIYTAGGHQPIWIDNTSASPRLLPRAASLIESLVGATDHALRLDTVGSASLLDALEALRAERSAVATRAARVDVLLTASLVAYATDLLTGQVDPRSVNREWHIDPQRVDVDSAVTSLLRQESLREALARLQPQDAAYAVLREELARYRQIVASGGWPRMPSLSTLRPGDTTTADALGVLQARLQREGYAAVAPLVPVRRNGTMEADAEHLASSVRGPKRLVLYDVALAGAVAEYQRRHGLVVDSIVGPRTLASLDRPAEFRLRQIAANLERHRWLPRERGDRFVVVNVPAFRLRAYDAGREVLSMSVVVGAEYGGRTTPVFSDSMSYVVFRPYWNVPQGIANRELWPKQRRDPTYFSRNGYEVVRADWGTYVRQKPAPDNALGRAKFIFPNDFAIYLHDTPAQALFAEQVRAFSHGCIRVEHPDQLAEFVLGPQGWDIQRVREAMSSGADDSRVNLERKLPVYIVYFTTFVRDGTLHFGNDIYDRDDALVGAIRGSALPDDDAQRVLVRLRTIARALGTTQ